MAKSRKGSRRQPQEGDVVVCQIPEKGCMFGRVVSTEAHADPYEAWTGLILLYVFRHVRAEPVPPRPLVADDLLFPPVIVDREPWTRGFLGFVENRPFEPGEMLPVHCFENPAFTTPKHFDQFGNQLPQRIEPCGDHGLHTLQGLERLIYRHLGLPYPGSEGPRPFAAPPPRSAEHCLTLYIPSGDGSEELDVGELERELMEAVEAAKVGEWEGHGTDLEQGVFDMRFVGRNVKRMLEAMRPVLERWRGSLPPGWYLTEHTDYTDAKRIDLT